MSAHIHSWIDGHLAVRHRAYETRGFVELSGVSGRWPRTTGADVVMIAALVDPAMRANGTPGVLRRWHATLEDLERNALKAPRATYAENRAFWSGFEAATIFLDDMAVMPPAPELWDALIAELSAPRNAGPTTDGPIAHFDGIATYDDLFNAQLKFLIDKRGSDTLDQPPGFMGGSRPIPRTTNSDVLQLATYWTNELAKVKHVFGHDGVVARWTPVVADVDKLAKPGKPDDVYAKNNEFWREAAAGRDPGRGVRRGAEQVGHGRRLGQGQHHAPARRTSASAASKGADLVGERGARVGKVVERGGQGAALGLGAPILIGAGLLGVFLISRNGRDHESKEA